MQKIIPLFNQLQEILQKNNLNNTIQLPQVVAVGAQSTGKSSVLESILGKDLLPRGTGIVTRRPIVLQLNNIPPSSEEYIEFGHKHGEKFTDWHLARVELEQEMDRVAGENKGISADAIIVRMYSPHVVNLNIVDLPGITKIPVGDQPADIEQRVYEMIMTYIKNPNSIILAVTPANVDLANSDSLKLAREVDPDGNRTLGVITKLDLMEENTHCLEALEGKLYKLKLGYVGVVSRSQKDLDNKKSVHDAVEDEKAFFRKHKVYGKFHEKLGIDFLTKELSRNFLHSIKKTLPAIKESLQRLVQESDTEMARNGDFELDLSTKEAKSQILLSIVSSFADTYSDIIGGNYVQGTTKELFGGARINHILYDIFNKAIDDMDPFLTLTDEVIRVAIRNANGLDPAIFLPESAFENLVIQQIIRLERPVNDCLFLVNEELRKVIHLVNIPGVSRFRMLEVEIDRVLEEMLKRNYQAAKEMTRNLLEIEIGHINTNHPDFIGGIDMLIEMADSGQKDPEEKVAPSNFEELRSIMLEKLQNTLERKEEKKELIIREINLDDMRSEKSQPEKEMPQSKSGEGNHSIEESIKKYDKIDFEQSMSPIEKRKNQPQNHQPPMNTYPSKGSMHNSYHNPAFFKIQLPEVSQKMRLEDEPNQREALEVDMIKKLVISYFNVIKKNINDSVIKTIITFMINKLKNGCEKELVTRLYKEELYDKLLVEDQKTTIDRKARQEKAAYLKRCNNLVTEMDSKI